MAVGSDSFAFALPPDFAYEPVVLTRPDTANLPVDVSQLTKIPESVHVERLQFGFQEGWDEYNRRRFQLLQPVAQILGKPRHFFADGIGWRIERRRQYRPWEVSWMDPAITTGLDLIRRFRPAAILASAPPFETLKAGSILHRHSGLPLIADFRDPWTYGILWNPRTRRRARAERLWERRVVEDAAKVLVVTPSMHRAMAAAYPFASEKTHLLMNGYEDFDSPTAPPSASDRFIISFVGTITERRLPPILFDALRNLRKLHPEVAASLTFKLIGPHQCSVSPSVRIAREGLADVMEYVGPVGHDPCRALMRESDVLFHIEPVVDYAVSSKMFEYLSAQKPIIGILPVGSDDEWFLERSGAGTNAGLNDAARIAAAIVDQWQARREGRAAVTVDPTWLLQFHRRAQTKDLARLLDEVTDS